MRYDRRRGETGARGLSDTKVKPPPGARAGVRPRRMTATGTYVPWRLATPGAGESVRWECVDGRWVAIALGQGSEVGSAVVSDSTGRRQVMDSYEGALEVAKRWRTLVR
jgi:hypothetical protein